MCLNVGYTLDTDRTSQPIPLNFGSSVCCRCWHKWEASNSVGKPLKRVILKVFQILQVVDYKRALQCISLQYHVEHTSKK